MGNDEAECCIYSFGVGDDLGPGNPFRQYYECGSRRAPLVVRIAEGQVSLSVPKSQGASLTAGIMQMDLRPMCYRLRGRAGFWPRPLYGLLVFPLARHISITPGPQSSLRLELVALCSLSEAIVRLAFN